MANRPIIFSAPMVRALLAGTKTQTRRVIASARVFATPEQQAFTLRDGDLTRAMQGASRFRRLVGNGWSWEADAFEWQAPHTRTNWMAHIGFAPGDRLWVREAWRADSQLNAIRPSECSPYEPVWYEADKRIRVLGCSMIAPGKLRPGMFMPRWASRLTLTVTDVRVERLQDISEKDAIAEGVERSAPDFDPSLWRDYQRGGDCDSAAISYETLWDAINGTGAWETNPWVAVYTFIVAHQNIDEGAQP